jgi:hypothetical protein
MMHARQMFEPVAPVSAPAIPETAPKRDERELGNQRNAKRLNSLHLVRLVAAAILLVAIAVAFFGWRAEIPAPASAIAEMRGTLPADTNSGLIASTAETAAPSAVAQAPTIPSHPLRTALMLLHFAGLVFGLGSALFLDLYLASRLYHRPVERHSVELLRFGSHIVTGGLVALWVSGLGFLAFYAAYAPDALANPKLLAKLAVVLVLTVNGGLLHRIVLPRLKASIGRPLLLGQTLNVALVPLAAGVVSGLSWATACLLGIVKEINYVVPAPFLLAGYCLTLMAGIALMVQVHRHFSMTENRIRRLGKIARLSHA